nr:DUF2514 family protein [uncultured Pseudomonas sp.]
MTWLKVVPAWCWWLLAVAVVAGGQQIRIAGVQSDLAAEQGAHASYRTNVADRDRRAALAALQETKRRINAAKEIEHDSQQKIETARVDADRASDALQRLQQQFAAITARSRACGNTITAQLSESAESAARVQADMFRRVGEAARLYAQVADERGIAGLACEAAYRSLE